MSDKKVMFLEVTERLKLALDISSEVLLAERLELKYSAWSMRKSRNTLPKAQIDALIEREQLNPEFIYHGTGPVHVPVDGVAWGPKFQATLAAALEQEEGWLVREGYQKKTLKSIAAGKASLSPDDVWPLIRDLRKVCKIDLNAFFCDEPGAALNADEEALIDAYRKAQTSGKEFIRQAAGMAANVKSAEK